MVSKHQCYENIITCVDGSIGVQNINASEIQFIDIAGFELKTLKTGCNPIYPLVTNSWMPTITFSDQERSTQESSVGMTFVYNEK